MFIKSVGAYLPKNSLNNAELIDKYRLTSDDEWIVTRTGIKSRHIADLEETTAFMAIEAAKQCQIDKSKIKVLIVATSTNPKAFPSVATAVHRALGLGLDTIVFDINDACNGFVQAMSIAMQYIKNTSNQALVIGAEKMSTLVDWTDRATCVLFGDGAGAVVIEDIKQLTDSSSNTLSAYEDELYCTDKIYMNGQTVFKNATNCFVSDITGILTRNNLEPKDIDFFVPHQANSRILEAVSKILNFRDNSVVNTVKFYANTSAATIPIALSTIKHKLEPGMLVLLSGFGAGFRYGSFLFRN